MKTLIIAETGYNPRTKDQLGAEFTVDGMGNWALQYKHQLKAF